MENSGSRRVRIPVCTWMQFPQWYATLKRALKEVSSFDADQEENISIWRNVFEG